MQRLDRYRLPLVVLAGLGAVGLALNHRFLAYSRAVDPLGMNDIGSILVGYHAAPNLLVDGFAWWHGTWIQQGICAFRPLAAYLYWIDCWLADVLAPVWWGWVGFGLLLSVGLAVGWLTWRLTRKVGCTLLAALLSIGFQRFSYGAPDYWLFWFPIHQELLVAGLMIGTCAAFDRWLEDGRRASLGLLWALFCAAAFTKETAYLLPAFCGVLAAGRSAGRRGWWQVVAMVGFIALLWVYRGAVLEAPRNPSILLVQVPRKMGLFLLNSLTCNIVAGNWWLIALALVGVGWGGLVIHWNRQRPRPLLARLDLALLVGCGLAAVAVLATTADPATEVSRLFVNGAERRDLATLVLNLLSLVLLWRYRRDAPTGVAVGLLVLSYVPNIDFIGWHYDVVPWQFRCVLWGLLAELAVRAGRDLFGWPRRTDREEGSAAARRMESGPEATEG